MAGNTPSRTALTQTALANTGTPYVAQPAGTKMVAQGEPATAEVWNRALGAVQANVEYVQDVLDAPALRDDLIVAADMTGEAHGSPGLAGASISLPGGASVLLDLAQRTTLPAGSA
ncbi:MAG: hypothetical protein ACOYOB_20610, partial [Myxococcota bacterium]